MLTDYLFSVLGDRSAAERAFIQFDKFRALLLEWNEKTNLTAITDPTEIETKHFIDSLLALPFIRGSVLDVGTGAGFPAIPLKILLPDTPMTLADSLNKRILFLKTAVSELDLAGVTLIHSRAQELNKRLKFDTVVARAVAPMNVLAEYTLPFVKIGGQLIAYKAADLDEELNGAKKAISLLGGKIRSVEEIPLYGTDIVRKLVLVEKVSESPSIYPRGKNLIQKFPLVK